MEPTEAFKIALMTVGALATLIGGGVALHSFASTLKTELQVMSARLEAMGKDLSALAADVKAAGIDVLRERQMEHGRRLAVAEGEIAAIRERLHKMVNDGAGGQLALANLEHAVESIEKDVQTLKEDRR